MSSQVSKPQGGQVVTGVRLSILTRLVALYGSIRNGNTINVLNTWEGINNVLKVTQRQGLGYQRMLEY